jgi:acyl-CoA synthetase (AMP-forming)/AMP-acid ligase II
VFNDIAALTDLKHFRFLTSISGFIFLFQVALIYHPDDIVGFATAFYGCLLAGVTPVAVEPPKTKDVMYIIDCHYVYFTNQH